MKMKWLQYFEDVQKNEAMHFQSLRPCLDYGEVVYRSSEFLDRRWLVTHYLDEYNVFVENMIGSNCFERILAATFSSKERAIGFAAEMFLICCGKLCRNKRRDLTKVRDM